MEEGLRVGRFHVVRELGRGGQATVYEGIDPQLGQRVAIKFLTQSQVGPEALLRFQREGELLARLRHPNVVRVHELGQGPRGPYLVTDLVEGTSLAEARAVEPRRAAGIVRDLADAVAAVHAQGIVHRDLKPDNVVVGQDGQVTLLDFGIARGSQQERLTQTGTLVGTPAYMAPEVVAGSRDLDPRIDVYGLGAILYTLLCDRPPFQAAELPGLLAAIRDTPPEPPSRVRGGVEPALEAICLRALSKAPQARQATAAALRDELSSHLGGEPPAASNVSRAWKAAALVVLAALGAAVAATRPGDAEPLPNPAPQAVDPQDLVGVAEGHLRAEQWAQAAAAAAQGLSRGPDPKLLRVQLLAWLAQGRLEQVGRKAPPGSLPGVAARLDRVRLELERTTSRFVATRHAPVGKAERRDRLRRLKGVLERAPGAYSSLGSVGRLLGARLLDSVYGLAEELDAHRRVLGSSEPVLEVLALMGRLPAPHAPATRDTLHTWLLFKQGRHGEVLARLPQLEQAALAERPRFMVRTLSLLCGRHADAQGVVSQAGSARKPFELELLRFAHMRLTFEASQAAWQARGSAAWAGLAERCVRHARKVAELRQREGRGAQEGQVHLALAYLNAGRVDAARAALPRGPHNPKTGATVGLLRAECDLAAGKLSAAQRGFHLLILSGTLKRRLREAYLGRAVARWIRGEQKSARADVRRARNHEGRFEEAAIPWRTLQVTEQAFQAGKVRHLCANPAGVPRERKD